MKPREQRRKVLVGARMRLGSAWDDIRIVDISSRGLGLQARISPPRGAYVELCRGRQRIVARVVWSDSDRFGVQAQDQISIETLVHVPEQEPDAAPTYPAVERRASHRDRYAHAFDRSRLAARLIQFATIATVGSGGAMAVQQMVRTAMAPLATVSAALVR